MRASYDGHMAQAEQDAGGMKALLYDMLPQHVSNLNSTICQNLWPRDSATPLCGPRV